MNASGARGRRRTGPQAHGRSIHRWALLLAILELGCPKTEEPGNPQGAPATRTAAPIAPTTSAMHAPASVASSRAPEESPRNHKVALRYACDEKYESGQCAPLSEKYSRWLTTKTVKPTAERILRIDDGGPLGAEWNPSNDLVLFAAVQDHPRSLHVGDKAIPPGEIIGQEWVAFRVPLRTWRRAERRARAGDGLEHGSEATAVQIVDLTLLLDQDGSRWRFVLLTAYGE
jgi:hypothetical protein